MISIPLIKKPAWQVVAGCIARFFGVHFYDLYYGEKKLLSSLEPVVPSLPTEVRAATHEDLNAIIRRIGGEAQKEFDHNIAIDSTCYVAFKEKKHPRKKCWYQRKMIADTRVVI